MNERTNSFTTPENSGTQQPSTKDNGAVITDNVKAFINNDPPFGGSDICNKSGLSFTAFASTILSSVRGRKTYITAAIALGMLFGSWQGWWKIPQEVYSAMMFIVLVFLRNGVKTETKKI